MAGYKDSKMYKSKAESIRFVQEAARLYSKKKVSGEKIDYVRANKDEGKAFSFFRYITKKHTKTGRFGARTVKDREDSISALDKEEEKTGESYFDPFALKLIIPKKTEGEGAQLKTGSTGVQDTVEEKKEDEAPNAETENAPADAATEINTESLNETDENAGLFSEDGGQSDLVNDFVARVDEQIELARSNDFEAKRIGELSRLAVAQEISGNKEVVKENEDAFNAGKSFKSDIGLKEEVPDSFAVRIGISGPPAAYSQEYVQFNAKETKGLWARIKGLFFKKPSEEEIFMKFARSLPEYNQIVSIGKAEAAEAKMKYNAEEDPNVQIFLEQLKSDINSQGTGHTGVKMIARKDGKKLSEYSFGFVPVADAGMAAATTGMVINPDKAASAKIHEEADITHSNYLRAAAHIRGIVGSMRSYSSIGYNCTSFAADVARTAGMNLKAEDTSSVIMTHRHHSQRVDTPYTLARHLKNGVKPSILHYISIGNTAFSKRSDDQKIDPGKLESLKKELMPMLTALPAVAEISNIDPKFRDIISGLFEKKIKSILIEGAEIDYLYPVTDLKGARLAEMQNKRIGERIREFGAPSEQECLVGLLKDEDRLFNVLFNAELNIDSMKEFRIWSDESERVIREYGITSLTESQFMSTYYPGISNTEKLRIAGIILPQMWEKQKAVQARNKEELKGLKGTALIREIAKRAHEYGGIGMTGYILFNGVDFNDAEAVKKFLDAGNIALPEVEQTSETEENELPDGLNVPAKISDYEMDDMVSAIGNAAVRVFLKVFSGAVGIEGYHGARRINADNVARFLNRAKGKEAAFGKIAIHYARINAEEDMQRKEEIFKELLNSILDSLPLSTVSKMMSKEKIT